MFNCVSLLMKMELRAVCHANMSCRHISGPPEALYCPRNDTSAPCNHTEMLVVPLNISRPSAWNCPTLFFLWVATSHSFFFFLNLLLLYFKYSCLHFPPSPFSHPTHSHPQSYLLLALSMGSL